jgi:hypothetical protein
MMQQLLAKMEAIKEDFLSRVEAKMDANRAEVNAMADANQAEVRSILYTFQSELKETTTCQLATETKPDPRMKQSVEEHQEIPKEDAALMRVGEPRKRLRVYNLAAERRQKAKERTRRNRGTRRNPAAAYRKVSRRAKIAWRKRKLVRRMGAQENYGPRKEFSPTGTSLEISGPGPRLTEGLGRRGCATKAERE